MASSSISSDALSCSTESGKNSAGIDLIEQIELVSRGEYLMVGKILTEKSLSKKGVLDILEKA